VDKTINMLAFLMATDLLWAVGSCLMRSEHPAAHREFYEICKQHLEEMAQKRMEPSRN
jgi:hypothetical protein